MPRLKLSTRLAAGQSVGSTELLDPRGARACVNFYNTEIWFRSMQQVLSSSMAPEIAEAPHHDDGQHAEKKQGGTLLHLAILAGHRHAVYHFVGKMGAWRKQYMNGNEQHLPCED